MLFLHAFSECDTTSRIFRVGNASVVQKVIAGDSVLHECSKVFRTPTADPANVETTGCDAMVSLFNGGKSDSLASLRYRFLAKKVATAKTSVTPETLPPTTSATNLHSRRTYLQVMELLGKNDGMQPTEWGWAVQGDTLVPLTMKDSPAPNKIVHCQCSAGCSSMRCGCRKHALECTRARGNYQDGDCDNMAYKAVSDDDED